MRKERKYQNYYHFEFHLQGGYDEKICKEMKCYMPEKRECRSRVELRAFEAPVAETGNGAARDRVNPAIMFHQLKVRRGTHLRLSATNIIMVNKWKNFIHWLMDSFPAWVTANYMSQLRGLWTREPPDIPFSPFQMVTILPIPKLSGAMTYFYLNGQTCPVLYHSWLTAITIWCTK